MSSTFIIAQEENEDKEFEEVIQEFFITESVYPQEKNEIQFTNYDYMYLYDWQKDYWGGFEIEYGITDRFQVSSGIGYRYMSIQDSANRKGFTNLEVGALYNFYQSYRFSASLSLETELPTGAEVFGESEMELEPNLILAWQIGRMQTHVNLGMEFEPEALDEYGLFYNVAVLYPINNFVPTLEFNVYKEDDENNMFITPGFVYKINRFEVGSAFPVNIGSDEPKFGIIFALVFEFEPGDDD